MNGHFMKFVFLVAVLGAVLFSRMAYPTASPADLANVGTAKGNAGYQAVPLFILPSIAVSAGAVDTSIADVSQVAETQGTQSAPKLQAAASLVADLTSGTVFEGTNSDKRWPTASITKLMTAAVAVDKVDPATKISITEDMFAVDPTEQTLVIGGTYSVADLLQMMLLPSSNVAAEAIADFYGKGAFLTEMNIYATRWGMGNTYFGDPSGITATNQSTANDLLKLAQKIYMSYPQIFGTTRTSETYITEVNSGKRMLIKSIDTFAGEPDFIGGKTGHTDEASGNLLSVFRYGGRPILTIVLGTNDRFSDTQKLYDWFKANNK